MRLQISVRFLGDLYHGATWPPAPATLVQALIGAGRIGANRRQWTAAEEEALAWLETLAPPTVGTARFKPLRPYRLFVPDNDSDRAAKTALAGGRFDMAKYRSQKDVRPRLRTGSEPGPDVVYTWDVEAGVELERHTPALRGLARKLFALGWGVDMACADAQVSADSASFPVVFEPADGGSGALLRTPASGFTEDVLKSWNAFRGRIVAQGVNPYNKPGRYGERLYRRAGELPRRATAAFRLETLDGEGFSWPWEEAPIVAAWMRHAAAAALREERFEETRIAAEVLGHAERPTPRISFVPAPSVGHPNSDGAIRRVMFVESFGMTGEIVKLLELKLSSEVLTDEKGKQRARLAPLTDGESRRLERYQNASEVWSTVTPVVLHGYNTSHGKLSQTKTERLLLQAFADSGYPESLVSEVAFRPACSWAGPGAAAAIHVPRHLAQWPRYHVWVRFAEAVNGPVLAGIGRHYGLGLFAARRDWGS